MSNYPMSDKTLCLPVGFYPNLGSKNISLYTPYQNLIGIKASEYTIIHYSMGNKGLVTYLYMKSRIIQIATIRGLRKLQKLEACCDWSDSRPYACAYVI